MRDPNALRLRHRHKPHSPIHVFAEMYPTSHLIYTPFLLKSFVKLGKRVTYAHVVPKSEQTVLTKKQDVVQLDEN